MRRWTEKEKVAVMRMAAKGWSYPHIASELNRTINAVKKRVLLQRATPKRREYLDCIPNPFDNICFRGNRNFYRTI